ncbi:branched-chain amino acid ABC transporter permease [Sinorhizobium medicae]|uniref:branched-chain amino acid ABC transporter permease n=1 Tax=Sinorhizobium medicae TaxID=110321 RepID=UPI000FDC246C|nr:branched-chain amino acid ABC transporter permease [Sinorhizobium medicae]RVO73529.1 branched-chain amino acid ABC transporter permease [Sinorhizobium medicae]
MEELLNVIVAGLVLGGIYALVSVGLNLVFGVLRVVNFAHGEFIMLSMYATYWLFAGLGINPFLAIFLVMPLMFMLGMALQAGIIRRLQNEHNMQLFATFGLLMAIQNIVLGATAGQAKGVDWEFARHVISLGGVNVNVSRLMALVAATAIAVLMHFFLRNTMQGKAIRALIQDRRAARAVGINVERMHMLTFGAGIALAGLAGALFTPIYTLTPTIGGDFILVAFAVVVLGGLGSTWGAYIGGLIIGLLDAFAGYYVDPALKQAIWFLIFWLTLIVRPSGLLGQVGAEEVGFREQ